MVSPKPYTYTGIYIHMYIPLLIKSCCQKPHPSCPGFRVEGSGFQVPRTLKASNPTPTPEHPKKSHEPENPQTLKSQSMNPEAPNHRPRPSRKKNILKKYSESQWGLSRQTCLLAKVPHTLQAKLAILNPRPYILYP